MAVFFGGGVAVSVKKNVKTEKRTKTRQDEDNTRQHKKTQDAVGNMTNSTPER